MNDAYWASVSFAPPGTDQTFSEVFTKPPDPGGGEVERGRRAEPARSDDEHVGGQQPLLARDADLGDQHVPAVPHALRVVELARKLDREPFLGPGRDPARERDGVFEAGLAQRLREPQRPVAVRAVEDERPLPVRIEPRPEVAHRDMLGAGDPARLELPVLADVDEHGRIPSLEELSSPSGVDLEGKLAVTRHARRIIRRV
jgi:hypothetical protein